MTAAALVVALSTGAIVPSLHLRVALRDEEGTTHTGKDAVAAVLAARPDLFSGFTAVDPATIASVSGFNVDGLALKLSLYEGQVSRIVVKRPDPAKTRIRLVVAYDGTDFYGFQRQVELRSVQAELEAAVSRINGSPTVVNGSSRTDTGVHARGQVAHFDSRRDFDAARWKEILNHALPEDVRVVTAETAHPLFHARFDVWEKEYRYILDDGEYDPLLRHFRWYCGPFDETILRRQLEQVVGTHDFTTFSKGEKESKVRTIRAVHVERTDAGTILRFVGDGFLHNMIRLLVAAAVRIAQGTLHADMAELLREQSRERTQELAPPGGLTLMEVRF